VLGVLDFEINVSMIHTTLRRHFGNADTGTARDQDVARRSSAFGQSTESSHFKNSTSTQPVQVGLHQSSKRSWFDDYFIDEVNDSDYFDEWCRQQNSSATSLQKGFGDAPSLRGHGYLGGKLSQNTKSEFSTGSEMTKDATPSHQYAELSATTVASTRSMTRSITQCFEIDDFLNSSTSLSRASSNITLVDEDTAGDDSDEEDNSFGDDDSIILGPTMAAFRSKVKDDGRPLYINKPGHVKSSETVLALSDILKLVNARQGQAPASFGSMSHMSGCSHDVCRPCRFERTAGRCKHGMACEFCHMHEGHRRRIDKNEWEGTLRF